MLLMLDSWRSCWTSGLQPLWIAGCGSQVASSTSVFLPRCSTCLGEGLLLGLCSGGASKGSCL